eukprot:144248-Chlamydomonas_euryale.AAC.1
MLPKDRHTSNLAYLLIATTTARVWRRRRRQPRALLAGDIDASAAWPWPAILRICRHALAKPRTGASEPYSLSRSAEPRIFLLLQ